LLDKFTVSTINTFNHYFKQSFSLLASFNQEFFKAELIDCPALFYNYEGHSLDIQQLTAIVTNEDNCLVVAGGGTGNTNYMLNYLTNRLV